MGSWFWINWEGAWGCIKSNGNIAMLTVEMWAFLSGFSCPLQTLRTLAPILLGLGKRLAKNYLVWKELMRHQEKESSAYWCRIWQNCLSITGTFGVPFAQPATLHHRQRIRFLCHWWDWLHSYLLLQLHLGVECILRDHMCLTRRCHLFSPVPMPSAMGFKSFVS